MKVISAAVLSALFCTVKEEHRTAFFGEDIHIDVPSGNVGEVVFKSRINKSSNVVLLQAGQVVNPRGSLNTLGHLVLEDVQEEDEGMYIIKNTNNTNVEKHLILVVREHQIFMHLSHGENLKIKLYLHHSNVNVVYRPKSDNQDRVIVDQGVLMTPLDPLLEGRLTVEGSELIMKKVHVADTGVFKVSDLAGFPVAHVYIEVEAYKLPALTVAILSMLGLIAFMLLVCLLSCLYKVHKRNEKNKKLMLIAQQAGKGEGEAFRQ
eukprot:superscaffoldBa00001671_g11556